MPVNPVTQEEQPALFSEFDIKINRASVGTTALRVSDSWLTNGTWAVKRTRVSNQTIFTCACCLQRDTGAYTLTPIEDYFVEGMLNPDDVMERWARTDTQVEVSGIDFTRYQSDAGQICYVRRTYQEHFHLGYLYGDRPESGLWDKPSLFDATMVIAAHREPQHMRLPLSELLEASQTSLYVGNDTHPADAPSSLTQVEVEELEYERRQLGDASFPGIPDDAVLDRIAQIVPPSVEVRVDRPDVHASHDEGLAVGSVDTTAPQPSIGFISDALNGIDSPGFSALLGGQVARQTLREIREQIANDDALRASIEAHAPRRRNMRSAPVTLDQLSSGVNQAAANASLGELATAQPTRCAYLMSNTINARDLVREIPLRTEWLLPAEVAIRLSHDDPALAPYLPTETDIRLNVGDRFSSGEFRGEVIVEMIVTCDQLNPESHHWAYGIKLLQIRTDGHRWLAVHSQSDRVTMQFIDAQPITMPQPTTEPVGALLDMHGNVDFTLEADATPDESTSLAFPVPVFSSDLDPVVVSEDLFNRLRTSATSVRIDDATTWRVNRVANIRIVPLAVDDGEGVVIALRATTESSARGLGGAVRAVRSGNSTLWVSENSPRMFIALNDDDESRRDWMIEVDGQPEPFRVVFMPDWTATTHYVAVFITESNSVVRYVEQARLPERTNTAVRALLKEIVVEVLNDL
jgi:hypothetical protein